MRRCPPSSCGIGESRRELRPNGVEEPNLAPTFCETKLIFSDPCYLRDRDEREGYRTVWWPRARASIRVDFGFVVTRREPIKSGRKPPQQPRSRATVSAILDAAIRVLDREGADAATTSRVAEVAGVSVGTLYQYFSNRDAIIDALQDREFARATETINRVLLGGAASPVPDKQLAQVVIEELLKLYRAAPALHRLLAVEGLRVAGSERVQAFDLRMVTLIRSYLSLAGAGLVRKNLDAAAFVVYQSVRGSMLAYLLEEPAGVNDVAIVEELSSMLTGYLVGAEREAPATVIE